MKQLVISMQAVVEQTLALSAMHGILSGSGTPILSSDGSEGLRVLLPSLGASLALRLRPLLSYSVAEADEIVYDVADGVDASLPGLTVAVEQWLSRMLAAQLWASAAPGLAQEAASQAEAIVGELCRWADSRVCPPAVRARRM